MDPLKAVEDKLGSIETWPSYIIEHIFVDKPNARIMRNVAAFMYGNSIELEKAFECYYACNGKRNRTIMEYALKNHYKMWDGPPYMSHEMQYYNMKTKKVVWINGNQNCEMEVPEMLPEMLRVRIGLEDTQSCERVVKLAINDIRKMVL
jgi:hypothetical protein